MIRLLLGVFVPVVLLAAITGINPWFLIVPVGVAGLLAYYAHMRGMWRR